LKRAAEFTRRGHEVVAVAPDVFWYSGLATGMLGGLYPPALDQVDVAALVARGGGRFVCDRVIGVDPVSRTVHLAEGAPLSYDALSITLGSEPPAIPGADGEPMVFAVKPIRRLWELRQLLETRFREAPGEDVRVAIAGGGATACELAANIAQLARSNAGRVGIVVLAGGSGILAQAPPAAARKLEADLKRRGIRLRLHARVERVASGRAVVEAGAPEPFDIFVNATGLEPAPAMRSLGVPLDARGAMIVDSHLRSPADSAIHGGGDCIALHGHELPRIGVHAVRQAPVLFRNLMAALQGWAPRRFVPQRRYLWIINLGDGTGLALRGRLYWRGRAAFLLKDWIDRRFLRAYQDAARTATPLAPHHGTPSRPKA
jgi:NADH dehydrogenase FAD-containing subunit